MNNIRQALKDAELLVTKLREANAILLRIGAESKNGTSPNNLTKKEKEVYELLSTGLTTPEIAEKLHISTKTADVHRDRIKRKMGFKTSKDLYKSFRAP